MHTVHTCRYRGHRLATRDYKEIMYTVKTYNKTYNHTDIHTYNNTFIIVVHSHSYTVIHITMTVC